MRAVRFDRCAEVGYVEPVVGLGVPADRIETISRPEVLVVEGDAA